jgi:hypothetical protein
MRGNAIWGYVLYAVASLALSPVPAASDSRDTKPSDPSDVERSRPGEVLWRTDYRKAFREARATKQPLLLFIYCAEGRSSARLEQEIVSDVELVRSLNQSLVPVKVCEGANPFLIDDLHIERFPTIIFANHDGRFCRRIEGFQTAVQLRKAIAEVLNWGFMPREE